MTASSAGGPTGPGSAERGEVDLHLHSTASDGTETPTEVVERAARQGLEGLSLTDHDTVDGLEEAARAAEEHGLRFLPGAELSANEPGASIHILAFGFDPDHEGLRDFLEGWRDARARRAEEMVVRLREQGLDLTMEDVRKQAGGDILTRAHLGRALEAEGLVPDQETAFGRYLSRGNPAFVEKPPLRPKEVCDRVHEAGGVTLVAHPGRAHTADDIRRWVDDGIDGVEVLHPANAPDVRRRMDALAEELDLLRSGGSDWHGPEGHRADLGTEGVPAEWMDAIERRCGADGAHATTAAG
ncbi:MAG: PHP domain-containing protein [Candidatus Palauibacterales bacterium]|nr:PHP domain-containing protein [Candidatus Palauibacterales bacterium]